MPSKRKLAGSVDNSSADHHRAFWRSHQAALDGARIGTIHALCAILLRANAAALGIDPGFEILDEFEAAIFRDVAVEQALADLVETPAARLFTLYDIPTIRDVLRIALSQDALPDQSAANSATDRMAAWRTLYAQKVRAVVDDPGFVALLHWQPPPIKDELDKLYQLWQATSQLAARLPALDAEQAVSALREWVAGIKLNAGSQKAWGTKEAVEDAKDRLRQIRTRAQELLGLVGDPPGETDQLAAEVIPLWEAAVRAVRAVYDQDKAQARVLDFADLETRTRDLLRDPSVQARYRGAEFNHVLVDEFQDTNAAQRDIIYALTGLERAGSLFVVGDPKQSIYAFRGADVSVFEQVRREIIAAGGQEITLNTSFRAHRALIDGLNAIFSRLLVKTDQSDASAVEYGTPMISTRASEAHHSPAFDVIVLDKQFARDGEDSANAMRRWEAHALADHIRGLVADGWLVWDRRSATYRPAQYGDFAVLFQASRVMSIVEDAFKSTGLPYVTLAGKGYYDRPEVWDLLNLLRVLYNTADSLSLASVLRAPLYNLSDDALYALYLLPRDPLPGSPDHPERSLWDALMSAPQPDQPEAEVVTFARDSLKRLHALAGRVTIAELLTAALDETAYLAMLTGLPDGARRTGNVEKLIEMARRSGRVMLGDFLVYLQDLTDRETREGEAPIETEGAIQLMTVHASKGLEFPVVALFDSSWETTPREAILVHDPQLGGVIVKIPGQPGEDGGAEVIWQKPFAYRVALENVARRESVERLRVFYVGATRAQDRLIVSGQRGKTSPRDKPVESRSWLAHLFEVFDLPDAPLPSPLSPLPQGEGDFQIIAFGWGAVRYHVPRTPPDPEQGARSELRSGWDHLEAPETDRIAPLEPPLIAPPPSDRHAPARTLSVSQVALLGEAHANRPKTLENFRQHVLHDAPTAIRPAANSSPESKNSRRIIGEIVHKALQWQHVPGDLESKLKSYAWELGITDPERSAAAVQEAMMLLAATEQSPILQKMRQSEPRYPEQPFTLQIGTRTVSGKIDMLYKDRSGQWVVLDYKTTDIDADYVDVHARRYYLQVGIYAAAVEELTGQVPDIFLHYIRPGVTVRVSEAAWRDALAHLETDLLDALTQ